MTEIKNLFDLFANFGAQSQEVLDFISKEENQRKFERFVGLQNKMLETCDVSEPAPIESTQETEILIAVDSPVNKYITKEEYLNGIFRQTDVVGIAVFTPTHSFIVALDEWEAEWHEKDSVVLTNTHSMIEALQITRGLESTWDILNGYDPEDDSAAKLCWNYNHKGRQWYLPCLNELATIWLHRKTINEFLAFVGGKLLLLDEYYWSSSECSQYGAWVTQFSSGDFSVGRKPGNHIVRPTVSI